MGFTVRESQRDFDPMPEGIHVAVCYGFYDLGTHYNERYEKDTHLCLLCWEVPEERIEIEREGEKVNLPRAISRRYTACLNERSNLRKDLESWRGKKFTREELDGFDLRNILGKACQLQVLHNKTEAGKLYANIEAIMSLPKGTKPPQAENALQWYSMEEGMDIPDGTPQWIRERIEESREWQDYTGGAVTDAEAGQLDARPPAADDDIPF